MQGRHKGVVTQLKKLIIRDRELQKSALVRAGRMFEKFHPVHGIMGVHCVCHRFALVLSDCISKELIPAEAVELLRKVYEYFCKSGMRKRNLKKYVKKVNEERGPTSGPGPIEDPDDALHAIIRLECGRVKLPKKVVSIYNLYFTVASYFFNPLHKKIGCFNPVARVRAMRQRYDHKQGCILTILLLGSRAEAGWPRK